MSSFRLPVIRHLAWLCQAPSLVLSPRVFDLRSQLPEDYQTTLQEWDRWPGQGPPLLMETPQPRLGIYFERLYECVLTDLLGWQVLLKNQQIPGPDRTLGELDFIVRNGHTGAVEHHEIAVKFYLGFAGPGGEVRWYGPNSRDRLDLKTHRLLHHQSQLTALPETQSKLAALGIEQPVSSRIFMPGYLFYPLTGTVVTPPSQAPGTHLRGHWLYTSQLPMVATSRWVPLWKPHWLGPWEQHNAPDPEDAQAILAQVDTQGKPRLFAALAQQEDSGIWQEVARYFVVPAVWP